MSAPDIVPVVKAISQEQIARYADASGDHTPIHVHDAFARPTPFTIAHGMLVLASISEMMTAAFGEAWLTRGRLRVRFRAPARPDDTITATAEALSSSNASPRRSMLRYAVECRNQDNELLISGTAEVSELG